VALEDFKTALKGTREIELTVTGRKSGRKIPLPVWFVQDGERLYLLPVKGSETEWYRNVLRKPAITLAANRAADVKRYFSKLDVAVEVPFAG
jgi:F420H(2)-dependent quinone reductase